MGVILPANLPEELFHLGLCPGIISGDIIYMVSISYHARIDHQAAPYRIQSLHNFRLR